MSIPEPPVLRDDVQALIFDCDGTLADTFSAHFRAFSSALQAYGVEFTAAFYAARLGLSRRQLLAALHAETGVVFDDDDVAARTPALFLEQVGRITVIPFTDAMVRRHHGRLKLAVASAGIRLAVNPSLQAIGLSEFFDTIVTIEDTGVGKPAPDLFLKAADNLGIVPPYCHVFEDSDEGLEAAHRAGMTVTDIRPYYTSDPASW